MATHGKIGEFDPKQEPWEMYVERLELYFVANGVTEAEKKRAVLLTVSGPSTYKLIRNLAAPQKPVEMSYADIVEKVKTHFTPKPSVIMQRYKFHNRKQLPGESVASFVAELRQLSQHCDFGATLDEMIRDRLVCGIASGQCPTPPVGRKGSQSTDSPRLSPSNGSGQQKCQGSTGSGTEDVLYDDGRSRRYAAETAGSAVFAGHGKAAGRSMPPVRWTTRTASLPV